MKDIVPDVFADGDLLRDTSHAQSDGLLSLDRLLDELVRIEVDSGLTDQIVRTEDVPVPKLHLG